MITRRTFLVGTGAAAAAVILSQLPADAQTVYDGPDSTFTTSPPSGGAPLTNGTVPASPTFFGNSFDGNFTHGSGPAQLSMPNGIQEFNVTPDGICTLGLQWNETAHDVVLLDINGNPLGSSNSQLWDSNGTLAATCDSTYTYHSTAFTIYKYSRSVWLAPSEIGGSTGGGGGILAQIDVDSGSPQLLGMCTDGTNLYVVGPGGGSSGSDGNESPSSARLWVVPTGLSGIARSWNVPYARKPTVDPNGNVWVLSQGIAGVVSPRVQQYSRTGTLLQSWTPSTPPGGVAPYPMGIAVDAGAVYLADNSQNQQVLKYSYPGAYLGAIGPQGGCLAGPTPGLLGPTRFCGPRGVGVDSSGNLYVAQSGNPGNGQFAWSGEGPAAIVTKLESDQATQVWSVGEYNMYSGVGTPTTDWSLAYGRGFSFNNVAGQFVPRAYTADPWASWASYDNRIGGLGAGSDDEYGQRVIVRDDLNSSHRYLVMNGNGQYHLMIYRMDGELANPVVIFQMGNEPQQIITNGIAAAGKLSGNNTAQYMAMDPTGNVWMLGSQGSAPIWRFNLQGFASDGTPMYDWNHVDQLPLPPGYIIGPTSMVDFEGGSVYYAGYKNGDATAFFDNWKTPGRHISKFPLPAGGTWGSAVWTYDISFGSSSSYMDHPAAMAVEPVSGLVVLGWLASQTDQFAPCGYFQTIHDTDGGTPGTLAKTYDPPAGGVFGRVGSLDNVGTLACANGWVWCADDWASKTYGQKLP
jgi:hypothetical protein